MLCEVPHSELIDFLHDETKRLSRASTLTPKNEHIFCPPNSLAGTRPDVTDRVAAITNKALQ